MSTKIFIVDDHQAILESIKTTLNKDNYEILTCQNINDAIEILKKNKIKVLITDYLFYGEYKGLELIRSARTIRRSIKIMVYSGYYTLGALKNLLDTGIKVIIDKADTFDDLKEGFDACLNNKKFYSPTVESKITILKQNKNSIKPIKLSPRLKETLRLIITEPHLSEKQIADRLNVSNSTIHSYIKILREKFNVPNRSSLINHPAIKDIFPDLK